MAISAGQRRTLEDALRHSLGAEAAAIMMDHLPAGGSEALATRVDLERLEERIDARFLVFEERLGGKIEALRADFRGELLGAVQAQTRTLLLGMVGAVTSLTALAYALSRIFPVP